jgi:ribosome-associated protein
MEIIKTDELKNADSEYLANEAVKQLLEKKALDVKLYFVKETNSITDYYVNATGRSSTQVSALADDLADNFSDRGKDALRVEG